MGEGDPVSSAGIREMNTYSTNDNVTLDNVTSTVRSLGLLVVTTLEGREIP